MFSQLFHMLPTPALVLGVNGEILEANPQAGELLGVADAAALLGRPFADWVVVSQREAFSAALSGAVAERQRVDLTLEAPGEPLREVDALIANVERPGDTPKLFFIAVDVSREALLQRRLLHSDRLSQLGALVGGVAHELNNPLAAIAAFAELLATDLKDPDQRESVAIIRAEALRAGRIIATLLDFARQRPRVQQAVELEDVVRRVLALQRNPLKKARVEVEVQIAPDLPEVTGDPQELQQVLLNAVVNAVQAIAGTGRPGRILVAAQRADGQVLVTVEDNGPGVPAHVVDRVFEPFFSTKGEGGSGLGLAISSGIIRAMGGRMWLHNVEGGGARLVLELPARGAAPAARSKDASSPSAARKLSVFVVEDDPSVRRGVLLMARRLGHDVDSADGYAAARRHLLERGARYDVALVDIHLDGPHTGFELFDELQAEGRGRERRIIFATGDSISTETRDQLTRAERPVLQKPFSLHDLRAILDRVATGGPAGAG